MTGVVLAVAGSGTIGVESASAHHSAYCGHGIVSGSNWMTVYAAAENHYMGEYGSHGIFNHYHRTSHYYRSSPLGNPPPLYQYRHDGWKLCRVTLGPVLVPTTPASSTEVSAINGPVDNPVGCVLLIQTGGPVYAWVGPDIGCSQDVIWVEPGPPIDDSSSDNEYFGCLVCIGAATSADTKSTPLSPEAVALHADQPQAAVETLRAMGFDVDVYSLAKSRRFNIDRSVAAPRASDDCLIGMYSADFGPISLRNAPKHLAVEVADSRMARAVGHGC